MSIPETTEDLMKHIAYAVKIETDVVYQMEDRLREVNIFYLVILLPFFLFLLFSRAGDEVHAFSGRLYDFY